MRIARSVADALVEHVVLVVRVDRPDVPQRLCATRGDRKEACWEIRGSTGPSGLPPLTTAVPMMVVRSQHPAVR